MNSGSTRDRGRAVEVRVAAFLKERGLRIVDRNVERAGAEVDLIAIDPRHGEDEYVFVEVRSRSRDDLGSPLETVDARKQARVVRAATAWLVAHDLWERVTVRFDVVAVGTPEDGELRIDWIEHAFDV